jgi:hypothetical protein
MKKHYLTPFLEVIRMQTYEVICGGASGEDMIPKSYSYDDDSD